jgi:hypothetical protein
MQANRSQFVLKLLPSFADFAFLMPIAFLFGRMDGVKSLLGDCDTGWHIRTGEWIIANGWVPAKDIFSYSKPGQPWFAWEWLSEVLWAKLNALAGLEAVTLFSILLICVTFSLLYREMRRKANAVVAISLTIIAGAASSIHWLARPHLFTLLFLVLFYRALESIRAGNTRLAGIPYLAIFPAVTVLWTNLHGGFFVGILMIGAYGGGEFLRFLSCPEAEERAAALTNARGYFVSAAACLVASLANPYTYHLHVHMAKYLGDPWNAQHINEFLSPSFHGPAAIFFEILLVSGVVAAWWHASNKQYTEAILTIVWAHGGLLAGRNIPIYAILVAPLTAAAMQQGLNRAQNWQVAGWMRAAAARFNRTAAETDQKEAVARWHLVSVVGVALVIAVVFAPHPPRKFKAEFDPAHYPAAALAAMHFNSSAHIFTHDEWGDYLIWKLYPKGVRVFVDGRSDFYGDSFDDRYIDILNVRNGWEKTLGKFGVDTVLMPPDAPLTGALKESSRWHVVYDDGISLVFRSNEGTVGEPISAAASDGTSRDREITKTKASDLAITHLKSKT